MKAVNIMWDTDGDEKLRKTLPTEIEIPDGMTDEDEISDYLSDTTGFCHFGFDLTKLVKVEMIIEVDESHVDDIRNWEHHIDYAIDTNNYPEIRSISGVSVTEIEDN